MKPEKDLLNQAPSKRKKKKKQGVFEDYSNKTGKNSENGPVSKSFHHSGTGISGNFQDEYYYEEPTHTSPSARYYNPPQSNSKGNNQYLQRDAYHDPSYKDMYSQHSFKYYHSHGHDKFSPDPSYATSNMHSSQAGLKMQSTVSKKNTEVKTSHQVPSSSKMKETTKNYGNKRRSQNNSPPSMLLKSQQISSEISTKPSQPILPQKEEMSSYQLNPSNMYRAENYIPLVEEDEPNGYGELYPTTEQLGNHSNIHSLPNIGQPALADSPSNYKPFGTHFGPKILNRYGSNMDYFTPQAKVVMGHPYAMVPGDSSTKSSTFKKSDVLDSKTMPTLIGFSSLAEHVAKRRTMHSPYENDY